MTICIAASCESGQAVVVASDHMLTAPFLTVEFDTPDAKIDQIGRRCVALSAGNALCVQDVVVGGIGAASRLQDPTVHELATHIKLQYCEVRKQRIDDLILGPRGIDFDGFYGRGLIRQFPPELSTLIDEEVQKYDLGTSFLVAGVDRSGAHIYSVDHPGMVTCFDRVGYHAIGIGNRHAALKLVGLGQHQSKSIRETVFNVFCAKRVSELGMSAARDYGM